MDSYKDKASEYFSHARREIAPLLPPSGQSVLEIGCGTGATLQWLRDQKGYSFVAGCEISAAAVAQARESIDGILQGDAESLIENELSALGPFDLVLCLDVLEHLVDPWKFLRRLKSRLAPHGVLVASIPNARNIDLLLPLVLHGRWEYTDEGILDRTHLRFFTRSSAIQLIAASGYHVDRILETMPDQRSRRAMLNRVTLGRLRDFLAIQFLISARITRS